MYKICSDEYEYIVKNAKIESVSLLHNLKGNTHNLGSMPFIRKFILCWKTACFELRKEQEFAKEVLTPGMVISVDANVDITLTKFDQDTKIMAIREAE